MNQPVPNKRDERQEHLQNLATFYRALRESIERESFALTEAPSAERSTAKIGRLRLGDCARLGCTSYFYRLTFCEYAELDWPKILSEAESASALSNKEPGCHISVIQRMEHMMSLRAIRPASVGIVAVLILLVMKQLYLGGRIPLIREPENFRVDPAPAELEAYYE